MLGRLGSARLYQFDSDTPTQFRFLRAVNDAPPWLLPEIWIFYKLRISMSYEYEIGTKVNLKEMMTPEGLRTIKKGEIMHFVNNARGKDTWIKVIKSGFWRFEGEIVAEPLTPEEAERQAVALEKKMADEIASVQQREDGNPEPNATELLITENEAGASTGEIEGGK